MVLRIIASVTTRPPPYHKHLNENLKTLVGAFDAVYLGLPHTTWDGIKYTTPDNLPEGVSLVWLKEDLGPARKIMGGLAHAQEADMVVTFDDDWLYNGEAIRRAFERVRRHDLERGLTRVYSFSGTYIRLWAPKWVPWRFCLDGGWHDRRGIADYRNLKPLTTISGYGGVAYPSGLLLGDDIVGYIRACVSEDKGGLLWKNDDIVLSSFVAKHGVQRVLLPSLNVGEGNKEKSEPSLSPQIVDLLAAARHPSIRHHLLAGQPKPARLVLADVVVVAAFFVLLIFWALKANKNALTLPMLCLIVVIAGICTGYSKRS